MFDILSYDSLPVPAESNYSPPFHSCLHSKSVHSFVNSLTVNLPINQILLTPFSYRVLGKENLDSNCCLGKSWAKRLGFKQTIKIIVNMGLLEYIGVGWRKEHSRKRHSIVDQAQKNSRGRYSHVPQNGPHSLSILESSSHRTMNGVCESETAS